MDDAVIDENFVVNGYRWYSMLMGLDAIAVDFMILTSDFEFVVELRDLRLEGELNCEGGPGSFPLLNK